jgi:hypothetical protein
LPVRDIRVGTSEGPDRCSYLLEVLEAPIKAGKSDAAAQRGSASVASQHQRVVRAEGVDSPYDAVGPELEAVRAAGKLHSGHARAASYDGPLVDDRQVAAEHAHPADACSARSGLRLSMLMPPAPPAPPAPPEIVPSLSSVDPLANSMPLPPMPPFPPELP